MKKILTLTAALLMTSFLAQANLFTNESFETGNSEVGTYGNVQSALPANDYDFYSTLPGWTVGANGVEIQTEYLEGRTAHDGSRWIELDTDTDYTGSAATNSTISWTSALDPGGIYEVSFYYQPRTATADTHGVGVYLDGAGSPFASVNETTGTWSGWGRVAGTFSVAYGDTNPHMITFAALGTADEYGGLIDSLSLEKVGEIPEPATLALVGFGLIGLYFVRRRRRKV